MTAAKFGTLIWRLGFKNRARQEFAPGKSAGGGGNVERTDTEVAQGAEAASMPR